MMDLRWDLRGQGETGCVKGKSSGEGASKGPVTCLMAIAVSTTEAVVNAQHEAQ